MDEEERRRSRVQTTARPVGLAIVAVTAFLLSIRLLSGATASFGPVIAPLLDRVVTGPASALGASWLATYSVLNGTIVAALAVVLFNGGLVAPVELFLMICGSRLGSVTIVLFIGAVEYVQRESVSFRDAMGLGTLSVLVTYSVYIPAIAIGYLAAEATITEMAGAVSRLSVVAGTFDVFDPVVSIVLGTIGPVATVLGALALLFGSLRLLNLVFESVDTSRIREYSLQYLDNRGIAFTLGLVLTILGTSVAFSLGIVVPLMARGYVKRNEILPYVLGANLGTLTDTVVIAALLDEPAALAVVVLLTAIVSVVTAVYLVRYSWYGASIASAYDVMLATKRRFITFLGILVAVPAVCLLVELLV
jgi:sodium-dependent phosphate cotransporter